ncbi:unnamed protein product [Eruca vesicaria subsp. sativa]|uniref:RING-type domain-containing protein n=1 Tax=Eruca vesicaria subsp. sativa TaxID=29727 RepID=A0ABC8L0M8_ERUVS|nr:unnamed protein product [Eruca vesicaria subsp. sativa]
METKSLKVEISVHATPQGLSFGFLNSVLISQSWVIEEFFVDENDDGNITSLGSYTDDSSSPDTLSLLRLQDFTPTNVHQQIKSRFNDPVLSRLITDRIVLESSGRTKDLSQGPLLITTTKVEGTCAVCLEDMLEEESEQALCQPPDCSHVFHEDCLIKWLNRHDSCPLCRQSTNPLTNNNPSKALEKLTEA